MIINAYTSYLLQLSSYLICLCFITGYTSSLTSKIIENISLDNADGASSAMIGFASELKDRIIRNLKEKQGEDHNRDDHSNTDNNNYNSHSSSSTEEVSEHDAPVRRDAPITKQPPATKSMSSEDMEVRPVNMPSKEASSLSVSSSTSCHLSLQTICYLYDYIYM